MWSIADIAFELVDDTSDDPIVAIWAITPVGRILFAAELVSRDTILTLRGLHVQESRPNAVGAANLMVIAQALMERFDYDALVIEGATRSTGANPGHNPGIQRFTRRVRPARAEGPPPAATD